MKVQGKSCTCIKHQWELMLAGFAQMEKRFEQIDKQFEKQSQAIMDIHQ